MPTSCERCFKLLENMTVIIVKCREALESDDYELADAFVADGINTLEEARQHTFPKRGQRDRAT